MTYIDQSFMLQNIELKNRIVMPPMCQYSATAEDGKPNDWHYIHYTSRAIGGTGLIIMEMTNVEPIGRITNQCLGLWSDDHIPSFKRIVDSVHTYGSKIGVQIAHAGRKAEDAPLPVAPSSISVTHDATSVSPRELTTDEVREVVIKFKDAVRRAVEAGFDCIELHGAHGYLIHQFHSPAINKRQDEYGKNLAQFGVEIIEAARSVMPKEMPLIFRISAIEYMEHGYGIEHSLELAKQYKAAGVDVFHVSTGGEGPKAVRPVGNHAAYQVPYARAFKEAFSDTPIIAVGKLDDPIVAESTIANGDADLVAIGRGMLNDPYWALHAIKQISSQIQPPAQYIRGM